MPINLIQYAFTSQALAHGLDPAKAILELSPREGEYTLREEDILKALDEQGSSIALVLFSGVQYYTGQWFPMESITRKAKQQASYYARHPLTLGGSLLSPCRLPWHAILVYLSSRGSHMY